MNGLMQGSPEVSTRHAPGAAAPPRPVYLIGFWPDYEVYTLGAEPGPEFAAQLVNLKDLLEPPGLMGSLYRRLLRKRYARRLEAQLREDREAIFLFQDNLRLLRMIESLHLEFNGGVLARDAAAASVERRERLHALKARGLRIWSFDPADCAVHGYEHYPQFVRRAPATEADAPRSDLFFLGRDKGRAALLEAIRRSAQEAGLGVDFGVVRSAQDFVGYVEYLRRMRASRCLVEINQAGQVGYTMRAAEALLHGKKLITNNPCVRSMAGYGPDKVLVISEAPTARELREFLARPVTAAAVTTMQTFEASTVLRRICTQALERPSRV